MFSLNQISLTFGDRRLLKEVTLRINPGERLALTGPNGAGKSTLLKVITGELQPDEGQVQLSNEATVGYLPQDGVDPDPNLTVLEEVELAFEDLLKLQAKAEQAGKQLATLEQGTKEYEKTLKKYGELQNRVEQSNVYSLQSDIEKVLVGLGFDHNDFSRKTTEFSGGWLMRIALAKLLLQKPTYLLLDEPTNHLDIESLRWIEAFMQGYEGAVVVISHDKNFLNRVTERTLYLEFGTIEDYAGNYTYFEEKHAERMEQKRRAYKNQQREIKEIQEFIDRFRYQASKAKQVQSRIKKLEKMDIIELDERDEEISFDFPEPERSGAVNMQLKDINKHYEDIAVFENLSYHIDRGDKIAVVGPNGVGKSTLARIIAGVEGINAGNRVVGHNVTPAYFAQHQADELDLAKTAFDVMREAAPMQTETRIRTLLGCFLFQGEEVFKKVSVLSGGEKSRLALARMLLQPANFLIFDEPTNHLDMQSKQILQQALIRYEGTLFIVSHDIDFLDPVVSKVVELRPDELNEYLGNVSYYLDKTADREGGSQQNEDMNKNGQSLSRKEERRIEAKIRQKKSKKIKPLQKRLQNIESSISKNEKRQNELETQMAAPDFYDDADEVKEKTLEYNQLKQQLADAYNKWEEIASRIEYIEKEFEASGAYD